MELERIYEELKKELKNYPKEKNEEKLTEKITELLKKEDVSSITAIINKLYTEIPNTVPFLLSLFKSDINENILTAIFGANKKNEIYKKLIYALITLQLLRDNDYSIENLTIMQETFGPKISAEDISEKLLVNKKYIKAFEEINEKIFKHIFEYLKGNPITEEILKKNLKQFLKNMDKYDSFIFGYTLYGEEEYIIEKIFEELDDENINRIFTNTLTKNKALSTFDYNEIISYFPNKMGLIKGLYKKCNEDTIILTIKKYRKNPNKFIELLEQIVKINEEEEAGLTQFMEMLEKGLHLLEKELEDNKKTYPRIEVKKIEQLIELIRNNSKYQNYLNQNKEKLYDEAIKKLIKGNIDIPEDVLKGLGSYKKFIDNFDNFLTLFENSTDNNYKKKLHIPLVFALAKKQATKYDLEINITDTTNQKESIMQKILGSYERSAKKLYINLKRIDEYEDKNTALTDIFLTITHETDHAYKFQKEIQSDKLDYDNLVMAIDLIIKKLSETKGNDLYDNLNYFHRHIEREARFYQVFELKQILKNHPKLLNQIDSIMMKKRQEENYQLSDYIIKDEEINTEPIYYYKGIIENFIVEVKKIIEGRKKGTKYNNPMLQEIMNKVIKSEEEEKERLKEMIDSLPVIKKFFEIDFDNKIVRPKTKEELLRENIPSNKDEETIINWSINAFEYAKRVSESLKENPVKEERKNNSSEDSYSEEAIEEVIKNVGNPPRK